VCIAITYWQQQPTKFGTENIPLSPRTLILSIIKSDDISIAVDAIRRLQGSGCRGAHRPSIGSRHRKLKELLMLLGHFNKKSAGYMRYDSAQSHENKHMIYL
jgi:hypothetical protein